MLLLGPHEVLVDPKRGALLYTLEKIARENGYVYLVPIEELWPGLLDDIAPIRVVRPPAESSASTITDAGFRQWLDRAAAQVKLPLRQE